MRRVSERRQVFHLVQKFKLATANLLGDLPHEIWFIASYESRVVSRHHNNTRSTQSRVPPKFRHVTTCFENQNSVRAMHGINLESTVCCIPARTSTYTPSSLLRTQVNSASKSGRCGQPYQDALNMGKFRKRPEPRRTCNIGSLGRKCCKRHAVAPSLI
ncbi:hypothetical protein B0H34DRAFT_546468 [Crassisporium funariophilum]|nr:hypothetical protein B0H34DRAFT_546468 [Crassisporium funariophilum]